MLMSQLVLWNTGLSEVWFGKLINHHTLFFNQEQSCFSPSNKKHLGVKKKNTKRNSARVHLSCTDHKSQPLLTKLAHFFPITLSYIFP